jgi:succinyl-CoA synthetase beta subunit
MVNGAGLAMATMDLIAISGAKPANFLDVGGSASSEQIEKGFRIILKDPSVKAILVNIFGGIVRCDRVANGIIEAYRNVENINIPIIVRLQGTNAQLAKEILESSKLKLIPANTLDEVIECIKAINL